MTLQKILIYFGILIFTSVSLAKTVGDTLEITKKNIEGHKNLYNEGWFIVTSSKDAIETARQNSISSVEAINKALTDLGSRQQSLKQQITEIIDQSVADSKKFHEKGIESSKFLKDQTKSASRGAWSFSKVAYSQAYSTFTLGYLEFRKRNADDWDALRKANTDFAKRTLQTYDDREIKIIMDAFYDEAAQKSDEALWAKSLVLAKDKFNESYEESGKKNNSLSGLGSIIGGYFKAIYHGIISPTKNTAVHGIQNVGAKLTGGILGLIKISGDVVFTTGVNIFYASKIGYNLISPTLEGGLLGSLALVSSAATPIVYGTGNGLATINQVAITAATPLVGTGEFVVASSIETAKHAALMTYDLTKGTGTAVANTGSTILVLGYNALTALPTQTLLAAGNSAVFLAYDGPHLAIVALRGEIDGIPINQVPVGTVLDAEKLKDKKIESKVLNNDPSVIQKVLETAPLDLN